MFDLSQQPEAFRQLLERVARRTGHPAEAVYLVYFALHIAGRGLPESWWMPTESRPLPDDLPVRHLTAVEVCDAVCRCARARVGDEARRYFYLWGLKTGGDVGRIVYGFIAEGVGTATPDDRPEQFDRVPLLRLLNPVRTVKRGEE